MIPAGGMFFPFLFLGWAAPSVREKEFLGSGRPPRQLCESRYKSTAGDGVSELKKKKHLKKMMIMTLIERGSLGR